MDSVTSELLEKALDEVHVEINDKERAIVDNKERLEKSIDNSITTRFKGASWFEKINQYTFTILGYGGISSWVSFFIGRCKPGKIKIYDPDIIDSTNIGGQLFSKKDIGEYKIIVARKNLKEYANFSNLDTFVKKFNTEDPSEGIMICGTDNMKSREDALNSWLKNINERKVNLFIDGRLAAERFEIYCLTSVEDTVRYKKEFFSDEEAEEVQCSYKQTAYCANLIAGMIFNLVVNYIDEIPLPFKISYDASNMLLNKEF